MEKVASKCGLPGSPADCDFAKILNFILRETQDHGIGTCSKNYLAYKFSVMYGMLASIP